MVVHRVVGTQPAQPVVVEIVSGRKLRSIKFPSQYSDYVLLLLIHIHGTNYAAKEPTHDRHLLLLPIGYWQGRGREGGKEWGERGAMSERERENEAVSRVTR